ncbi:NADH-quinone oxidoreductase subunit N [Streptomyces sp. NPDC003077]|uniref:NADH-quinone oxidoreductase subunit N n=1 Tax=Streptomyces sp. NPDC003077 TaxID=3154443 RepID=UPI0033AF6EFC
MNVNENPLDLLPEVLLAGSAVTGLLLGSWLPRARQWLVGALAAVACAAGVVAAAVAAGTGPRTAFGDAYALDPVTATCRVVVLVGTLGVLALAVPRLRGHPRETEWYVLLQLAALGTVLLAGAQDLLLVAAAYLLASLPAYVLAGFAKDGPGTEAALKFYVTGALLGALMLGGVTLLLAAGRATGYPVLRAELPSAPAGVVAAGVVGVLAGLLFKAGGVPGHFWVPDAIQGTTGPAAAFLSTVPKLGALAACYRLGSVALPAGTADVPWAALFAVLSAASMTLGNLAAFFQEDVRRLLAYSTVSQVGYLLLPVAAAGRSALAQPALLFYLAAYAVTNLGAFAVVCALPGARRIADHRGLARTRPVLAGALAVCLLGLVGTPPTGVFFGKLQAFGAVIDAGYAWLALLAVANTVASLFYYLRWIAPVFSGPAQDAPGAPSPARTPAGVVAGTAAVLSVALGLVGGPLLDALNGTPAG